VNSFFIKLKNELLDSGYNVLSGDDIQFGDNIREKISEYIHASDVFIALLTTNTEKSKFVYYETASYLGLADVDEDKLFIPIFIGDADFSALPKHKIHLKCPNPSIDNATRITNEIQRLIERNRALIRKRKKIKNDQIERIENSKTEFILHVEERLNKNETTLKVSAYIWYGLGYTSLALGSIYAFNLLESNFGNKVITPSLIFTSVKGFIAIVLLMTTSKYAYSLGRSYMNESLKNSDRLHAIAFGKFYLQAYGDSATSEDIKEVFQHWNINKEGSFKEPSSSNADGNLQSLVFDIAKLITKSNNQTQDKK
jgi:hypothetical protein